MVIFAGPVIARVLLWTRLQRVALFLLGGTMAGALVFGLYYHFVAPGADNALGLAPGYWSTVFLATSVLLAAIEALGCAWAVAVLRRRTA
jgi:amino acid permease